MIGRDIKWEIPKIRKTSKEQLQMIYINELLTNDKLNNNFQRPITPIKMGMDKIRSKSLLVKYLVDIATSSTLHGLNHMTAPRRHIIERFLAGLFIAGALAALILLSLTFWQRYQDNPIVIVLDHDYRQFNIKLPATIVCPIERIDEKLFPQVFKKYGLDDTIEARNFFNFISNVSYLHLNDTPDFNSIGSDKWLLILNDLKPDVKYHTTYDSYAKWIVTENGICLTFNNYVSPYSSIEYWINNNWTVIESSSKFPSLNYKTREINNQITVDTHDHTFSIYDSNDMLNDKNKFFICKRMTMVTIEVIVIEVTSSKQVEKLSLKQRKCKFNEEGGLDMWPIYSVNMCRIECKYKRILKFCHCYPHFARPIHGIPICNVNQLRCIGEKWQLISLSNVEAENECGCVENCNSARYVEVSVTTFALKKGSPETAVLMQAVIFPTDKYKREQIYGFNDFLASVGGAAGLFIGASVISFVELLYFATLRLYWYRINILRMIKRKVNTTI